MNRVKYKAVEFALSVMSGRIPAVYPQPDSWNNRPMEDLIGYALELSWKDKSEEEKREYILRQCEQEILSVIFPFRD